MAATQSGLTFIVDENSAGVLPVLKVCRARAFGRISDLPGVGIAGGTLDEHLLRELGKKGHFALIARDGKMLQPFLQRQAWRESKVTLFLLSKKWGNLLLGEMSRRLLYLWPSIVARAEAGPQGSAWQVSPTVPDPFTKTFREIKDPRDEAG